MKHYHRLDSARILCAAQIIDVLDGTKSDYNPLGWRGLRLDGHTVLLPMPDGWMEKQRPVSGAFLVQDENVVTWVVPLADFARNYRRSSPADESRYTVWPIRTQAGRATPAPVVPDVLIESDIGPVDASFDALASAMEGGGAAGWAKRLRKLLVAPPVLRMDLDLSPADLEEFSTLFKANMALTGRVPDLVLAPAAPAAAPAVVPHIRIITKLPEPRDVEANMRLMIECDGGPGEWARSVFVVTRDWFKDMKPQLGGGLVAQDSADPIYYAPGSFTPALPTRVTKPALEAMFRSVTYEIRPDGRTTVCEITFKNGFSLRGESSAATIDNFVQELGETNAYEKALDAAWGYAGFLLVEDRYRAGV